MEQIKVEIKETEEKSKKVEKGKGKVNIWVKEVYSDYDAFAAFVYTQYAYTQTVSNLRILYAIRKTYAYMVFMW